VAPPAPCRCLPALLAALLSPVAPAPVSAQDLPRRTAHEAFRIGGIDAPEHASFRSEPRLAVTAGGLLVVASSTSPTLELFDGAGVHLRSIGREGEGPGEFRVVMAHGVLGDTLWAVDFPVPRLSRFLLDGRHLDDRRLEILDRGMTMSAPESITALLRDGWTLTVPSAFPAGRRERVAVPVLLGRLDSGELRPVAERWMPPGFHVPGVGVFGRAPFIPLSPLVAVAGDGSGFAVAAWDESRPGELRLSRFRSDGTEAWTRTLSFPATRVSPGVRAAMLEDAVEVATPMVEQARRMGVQVRGSVESLVREGLHLPEHYPPVDGMVVAVDGGVWLRRGGEGEVREWIVLGPEGSPRFTFPLAEGVTIRAALGDSAWATGVGEYDVPYMVRFEVR
jgi:hypothetical protein